MAKKTFKVDMISITKSLEVMDAIPTRIAENVADLIDEVGHTLLNTIFEDAMEQESEDAFPEPFREHIREVLSNVDFDKAASPHGIRVSFDFNQLGTYEDLKLAFHQGARLADGSTLHGPYTGQTLENDDPAERHLYWEAVRKREPTAFVPKIGHNIRVKEGAWEQTMQDYISIWGDKAPQWLYLNFGQQKWEPKIGKHSILESFTVAFQRAATEIWDAELAKEIARAQSLGLGVTPTGRGYYNVRGSGGRFVSRGG